MKIGIDEIAFSTTKKYIDVKDLAIKRDVDPNKYLIGIGQEKQAVIPKTQDAVTLATSAASQIITNDNKNEIDMILVATESGIDNSKSIAIYVQKLLGINPYARTLELKQACYSGTAGLMMARDFIFSHPNKKVLVIATDIARYGLNTPGEITQGGGAVAMLITKNPKVLSLNDDSVYMSSDVMDFWRPLNHTEALVDGHYSANIYQDYFKELWDRYTTKNNLTIKDFNAFVFHLPFTKMGLKGLKEILPQASKEKQIDLLDKFESSRKYNKQVGNLYTGSLYLSLISLLDDANLNVGDRLGLFSYGSGAEGEFYSVILEKDYKKGLKTDFKKLFENREKISIEEYEKNFNDKVPTNDVNVDFDITNDFNAFILAGIKDQKRIYKKNV